MMKMDRNRWRGLLALAVIGTAAIVFSGCGHGRAARLNGYSFAVGEKAADVAVTMVGKPYRYGGNDPSGFDCSGLVQYSYRSAGMKLPHSTRLLKKHTTAVRKRTPRKGDLVFFKQRGKSYSHVGIYVGRNRFVHAPSTGKLIRIDSLKNSYWKRHFLNARRF